MGTMLWDLARDIYNYKIFSRLTNPTLDEEYCNVVSAVQNLPV